MAVTGELSSCRGWRPAGDRESGPVARETVTLLRPAASAITANYQPKCFFPMFDSSGHCIQRRKRVNITIGKGFTDVILTKCIFWVFHTFSIYSLSWCYFLLKLHVLGLILFAKVLATSIWSQFCWYLAVLLVKLM